MQYYYQRFRSVETYHFREDPNFTLGELYGLDGIDTRQTFYTSYKFDENQGQVGDGEPFHLTPREIIEGRAPVPRDTTLYTQRANNTWASGSIYNELTERKGFSIERWTKFTTYPYNEKMFSARIDRLVPIYESSTYSKGGYVTTVSAEDGTYPNNGRTEADGYWYVKVSQINVPPNAPIVTAPADGVVITAPFMITWNPSIDDNGDAITSYQVELTTNNGKHWSPISENVRSTSLLYDFAGNPDTSQAKIRVRGYDGSLYGEWGESESFTINYNYPPNPPYALKPNGEIVDKDKTIRLQWVHSDINDSDPQSEFELRWRLREGTTWNTLSEVTTRQYQDIPSNTFPLGEIEWQVRTYDQAGLVSEWSNLTTFTSGSKPNVPTWIYPTNFLKVIEAMPTFHWTSDVQSAYRVILYDENDFIVWDSEETEGTSKTVTTGFTLVDGAEYSVSVLIRNAQNFWSDEVKISFSTSYSPPPEPTFNLYGSDASIVVEINNPESTGIQPQTVNNEVYKFIDKEWVRIARNIPPNSAFVDYTARSGVVEQYRVKAIGDNEGIKFSEISSLSIKFTGVFLHDTHDPELTVRQFKFDGGGRSSNWGKEYSLMSFKGRSKPVVEFSEAENQSLSVTLQILENEELIALEELAKNYNTLCYRDGRGRLLFGFIPSLPVSDERFGNQVQLEFIGIDYKGSV